MTTTASPSVKSVRTLGQIAIATSLLHLVDSFLHLHLTADQQLDIIIVMTPVITFVQNRIEARSDKKNSKTETVTGTKSGDNGINWISLKDGRRTES